MKEEDKGRARWSRSRHNEGAAQRDKNKRRWKRGSWRGKEWSADMEMARWLEVRRADADKGMEGIIGGG